MSNLGELQRELLEAFHVLEHIRCEWDNMPFAEDMAQDKLREFDDMQAAWCQKLQDTMDKLGNLLGAS